MRTGTDPSACEGWSALDVLGHVGSAIAFGVSALRGEDHIWPESERPADLVSGEPSIYWSDIAARAREALSTADLELVMDTPMGPRTVADRLAFPAIDLFVHAWDISEAAGVEVTIPSDVIDFTHGYIDPFPVEVIRGGKGAFGPEVDARPTRPRPSASSPGQDVHREARRERSRSQGSC